MARKCKICKCKVHQWVRPSAPPYASPCPLALTRAPARGHPLMGVREQAHYCNGCAYKKGICVRCGRKVANTKDYKMSMV